MVHFKKLSTLILVKTSLNLLENLFNLLIPEDLFILEVTYVKKFILKSFLNLPIKVFLNLLSLFTVVVYFMLEKSYIQKLSKMIPHLNLFINLFSLYYYYLFMFLSSIYFILFLLIFYLLFLLYTFYLFFVFRTLT